MAKILTEESVDRRREQSPAAAVQADIGLLKTPTRVNSQNDPFVGFADISNELERQGIAESLILKDAVGSIALALERNNRSDRRGFLGNCTLAENSLYLAQQRIRAGIGEAITSRDIPRAEVYNSLLQGSEALGKGIVALRQNPGEQKSFDQEMVKTLRHLDTALALLNRDWGSVEKN